MFSNILKKVVIPGSIAAAASLGVASSVYAQDSSENPWTTWVGAGAWVFETDEELESGQMYQLKQGYRVDPRITVEGAINVGPFYEGNDFPAPDFREATFRGKNSPGEAQSFGPSVDVLYHLDENADEWDPYAVLGAGVFYYNRTLESGRWDPYAGAGAGIGYKLSDNWSVRGEYRVNVVGHDTEFNQQAMILLGYKWGAADSMGIASRNRDGIDESGSIDKDGGPLKTVYYPFDSSELSQESQKKLQENAEWLKKNPASKVIVEGHTDERGTNEYNFALGTRRARSAHDYMKNLGVEANRMDTISYGEERPADARSNEEAWAKNRRAETKEVK